MPASWWLTGCRRCLVSRNKQNNDAHESWAFFFASSSISLPIARPPDANSLRLAMQVNYHLRPSPLPLSSSFFSFTCSPIAWQVGFIFCLNGMCRSTVHPLHRQHLHTASPVPCKQPVGLSSLIGTRHRFMAAHCCNTNDNIRLRFNATT